MKISYTVIALCIASVAASAQTGGFTGPDGRTLVTAAAVATLPDDSAVRLVGYIVTSLGDEKYHFRDDTGTIVVEIDDEEWGGLEITPESRLEIAGEVDKEREGNEVDVDSVHLATQ